MKFYAFIAVMAVMLSPSSCSGTDAVYEMVTGGAPSGFSALILHPDNSITVN